MSDRKFVHLSTPATVVPVDNHEISINDGPWQRQPHLVMYGDEIRQRLIEHDDEADHASTALVLLLMIPFICGLILWWTV